ncbi:FitA-like ribbon-helix-helix domain-containing protein [Gordonia sp. (in: high G+C Gram-positive bacteria)]|jgi:plasmid stability protein|uniref:FitA-like ribbon-helix-helix domain-containing protein n=1 Tax=Gordonia sp. (in: high G+C Gram-positive bacteria) TaxID=84139 RepID=UPI001DAD817F|nr:plasmid stabilization protein [Gordonia sp. (in: high G+C Gram-positive bacteria)]MCB1293364.1 plasmid stabilization protein [Gordonia sp. (in: high G+C Gram-positive bacteria)]HMS77315.1 plasmid stabilization protein [Gordonia sp. (in: high G+C Gram-positive bacteria)]HQV18928.1 plasmid stabilization protein [Gordonia sp. (in: high G+C Gram-positive bacteria)]
MKNVTIRNLSDEVHRAIRVRAAENDRSVEAEMRAILAEAVQPRDRVRLGSMLAEIWSEDPLTDDEHAILNSRDRTPHEPMDLTE